MEKKVAFQKVIGKIRSDIRKEDNLPGAQYPKAMLTGKQAAKNQATVNCGGEWISPDRSKYLAQRVLRDERFTHFLSDYQGTAEIEKFYVGSCTAYQLRIQFAY